MVKNIVIAALLGWAIFSAGVVTFEKTTTGNVAATYGGAVALERAAR